jgi:hypothetical protein
MRIFPSPMVLLRTVEEARLSQGIPEKTAGSAMECDKLCKKALLFILK